MEQGKGRELRNVIIIGPQASGKGTQADILAEKLGIPHISIGDVFRKEAKSGSALGKQLKEYMDRGELIPQELNDAIVRGVLKEHRDGILLDGYPRTQHQAAFLDSERRMDLVIVLEVPDEICVERISGRRICDDGHDYHVLYKPPKREGVCDIDGKPLHMRDDDKPEAVRKRLAIFHEQTGPVIAHYAQQGIVVRVDGRSSIQDVAKVIGKVIVEKAIAVR